jgi:hypothetical protein
MLFYIAAQNKTADANPSSGLKWVMPPLYVHNVVAVLHDKDDPVLVHYAAKTIENIMIQAGSTYGHLFNAKVSQPSSSTPLFLFALCGALLLRDVRSRGDQPAVLFCFLPQAGHGDAIAATCVRT